MSTETTKKKIKIDNGTTFGKMYTDKAVDEMLQSVGGSAVGVIELNDNQYQELRGKSLTFNAVQAEIIKTHQLIILRHGNDLEYKGVVCKYNGIYTLTMLSGNFMYYMTIMNFEKANLLTQYRYPTRFGFEYVSGEHCLKIDNGIGDAKVYLSTINGTPIAFNYKENIKDYTFTEDKTIPLFGKYSILVPKDSADTSILPLPSDADTKTYTLNAANGALTWASVPSGGISVIELTDESGTIASAQVVKIGENPQNFTFKYHGKILSFTKADSTTYQYCNNITDSSDNNVGTASTLLTITSSTGAYTITENVHNVVANAAHPANGGDLTNIQVGSKVYSIPSGGGGNVKIFQPTITNVNVSTFDEDKKIEALFTANNEVETYIHSLVDSDKNFSANLFLKTLIVNDYQIRLISPLTLINIKGGNTAFFMGGRLIQSVASKIDFEVDFSSTEAYLTFYFDNNATYTQFKQLASLLFTTDTLLKLTIKTDE